jgi:hypothetical protein
VIFDLVLVVGLVGVVMIVLVVLVPLQLLPVVDVQAEVQLLLVSPPEPIHHLQHLGQWLYYHPEAESQAPQAQF